MNYVDLKKLVIQHCVNYYDLNAPTVTDAEFDRLYDLLAETEKAQGWSDPDSPTKKVGGEAGKIRHIYKLYSLKKVYSKEEVDTSFDVQTPKIDGTNLTAVYIRGRLKMALTRGNGELGDNVLHLAKTIANLPRRIETIYDTFVVNGECVTDNTVENFRNYVSGALGLKDPEEFVTRNIKFIAHDLLGVELDYTVRLSILANLGFTVVTDTIVGKYPQDGVVYRLNSYRKSLELGYTAKYPRFAVALKPKGVATAITTLQAVEWSIGRTGTINPIGIIDSVNIDDANITRVTLHNIGLIEEHKLGLGDTIEIERAGGVIPKFLRVVEHSKHGLLISIEDAKKALNVPIFREGPKLFLLNKADANLEKSVEHYVTTIGIKGLGPANIAKMKITSIPELYKQTTDWDKLGAVGKKIKDEIHLSKNKPYELVLAALGIPTVGKGTAKLIVENIPNFEHLAEIRAKQIKGIGPATIDAILEWLEDNYDWVMDLPVQLRQDTPITTILKQTTSKKICITGKLDMSRADLEEILTNFGFTPTSTVTKDCYALISAGDTSSSKYTKARQQGTPIIDYWQERLNIIKGNI